MIITIKNSIKANTLLDKGILINERSKVVYLYDSLSRL